MPRELKPCGTEAAYQRHLRHREAPCAACRNAHRQRVGQGRRNKELSENLVRVAQRSRSLHALGDPLADRIRRLEENLLIVDTALEEATPREVAALSKRRQDLEDAIWKLSPSQESGKGGGVLDELARRRAQRAAASAS